MPQNKLINGLQQKSAQTSRLPAPISHSSVRAKVVTTVNHCGLPQLHTYRADEKSDDVMLSEVIHFCFASSKDVTGHNVRIGWITNENLKSK